MAHARLLGPCTAILAAVALVAIGGPITSSAAAQQQQQQKTAAAAAPATENQADEPLSADELEKLVARIALYPDELVAAICEASLVPLQIVEAERFLEKRERDPSLKPKADWDGSVISLLNYPEVVKMMSEDLEWTQSLGDALTNQQKDVLAAIQQLRDEAVAKDIIKTDDKTKVVQQGDNIIIQPVVSDKVYIPRYDPQVLYVDNYPPAPISYYPEPYPNYYYPNAGFWAGAVTGAFWGAAMDWDNWNVWGGDWGGDVDIGCNNCLNNINGKINMRDVDWRNVDRSKLNFDRNQLANIDRTKISDNLRSDRANSIRSKADTVRSERAGNAAAKRQVGDIRQGAARPKDAASRADRGNAARNNVNRPNAGPANTKRPQAANRPSGKGKAGARVDRRPQPSALGNIDRGRAAQINSNRGRQSMGGGYRGGGHRPPVARSGGRGGASFHGGGRRMPSGGGGRRGGGGGRGRR
jgi:Protein of unknown function (DUF3300)